MAKIQLKSDNINPFGGLFSILNQFDRSGLRAVIDRHLGRRGMTKAAFTYGDVFASMFGSYLCGGDCIEDVMEIKPFWDDRDNIRIYSSDVILRTLRSLSEDSISYESSQKKSYAFNVNEKMNSLLLKCLAATGQLNPGDCVNLDFDHQFIAADKKDAKYSYKKADGYFPGVASIGGLIVGVENRDGNANVKFRQADTLERLFSRLERQSRVVIQNFRADCGSFSEEVIKTVSASLRPLLHPCKQLPVKTCLVYGAYGLDRNKHRGPAVRRHVLQVRQHASGNGPEARGPAYAHHRRMS